MPPVSIRPALVLGFGTSGARIAEGLQQRLYEVFRVGSLPIFQFLAIETDARYSREAPPRTPDADDNFTFLPLSTGGQGDFENFEHLLKQLEQQGIQPDWIRADVARRLRAQGDGARGARIAGRLILWANMDRVRAELERLRTRAVSPAARGATEQIFARRFPGREVSIGHNPIVVVCGTTTGGSFSGALIDLGYLCRETLHLTRDEDLYALLLLPPRRQLREADAQKKANAYGALVETEYFSRSRTVYEQRWPNTPRLVSRPEPPYGYLYHLSQDYGSYPNPIEDVGGLYQLAALKVFCDLIGLEGARAGGLADQFEHYGTRKHTFGLAAIMHPRYQLAEHAACELGRRLLDRWLDEQQFRDATGRERKVPSAERLVEEAGRVWEGTRQQNFSDGLLSRALDRLGAVEGRDESLVGKAERLVEDLREGRDLLRQSLVDAGPTLYGIIHENLDATGRDLARDIEARVWAELERTQNLPCAVALAEAFRIGIQRTIGFWDAISIPASDDGWSDRVANQLVPPIQRLAQGSAENVWFLLTNRKQVCLGMVLEAVDELKFFLMRKVLVEVQQALAGLLEELHRHRRMLERTRVILATRQQTVETLLKDETVPIARVWSKGSLGGDLAVLHALHPQPGAADIAQGRYTPGEASSRWMEETLRTWVRKGGVQRGSTEPSGTLPAEQVKQGYQQEILDRIDQALPIDLSLPSYDEDISYFERVQRGHLRYDDRGIRSIVQRSTFLIGPERVTRERRDSVNERLLPELRGWQPISLPGMDHALIFYHEEFFNEIEQLHDFDVLRHHYETPPAGIDPDEAERWAERRNAYGVVEWLQRERLQRELENLFHLVGDLFVLRHRHGPGDWRPVQVRPDLSIPLYLTRGPDGRPRVEWEVTLPHMTPRRFTVVGPGGELDDETVQELAKRQDLAGEILRQGAEQVREYAAQNTMRFEGMWREALENGLNELYSDATLADRKTLYFGTDSGAPSPGMIARIVRAEQG